MRIAIGGFQHETNTFAPSKADFAAFAQADSWPALQQGDAMLEAFAGMNVPIGGFIEFASKSQVELVPTAWAHATPSAHVTKDAFERMSGMILQGLRAALADGPLDGVYLDLHGAMVTEHFQDGEGDLLARVRRLIGRGVPLVASLDLHANVTERMMAAADMLIAYRTYPHVDMAETGARAAEHLLQLIQQSGVRPAKAFRKLDFLIPITAQSTLSDPAGLLYADAAVLEGADLDHGRVIAVSLAMGFPLADIGECGPAVMAYAATREAAEDAADRLADELLDAEHAFKPDLWSAADAVAHALAHSGEGRGPFVLADTQDNPGAGGNGDTVGVLAELIDQDARRAAIGVLYDPEVAEAAHQAGTGTQISVRLGAKTGGGAGEEPLPLELEVVSLSDGECLGTGPYYQGARISLGPAARLRIRGVEIVVGSKKVQCADQAMFRHIGVEPSTCDIVVVKSSVHFRADFGASARRILVVESPGPNLADHTRLPYKHLRHGVRLMPKGPAFAG